MARPLFEIEENELARQRTIREIGAALRDVAAMLRRADAALEVTDALKETFVRIGTAANDGLLAGMEREALEAALGEIAAVRRELRIASATPPPPPPATEEEAQAGGNGENGAETEGKGAAGEEAQSESSL
jgi:hypothetical protein